MRKLLVLQVAGLGADLLQSHDITTLGGCAVRSLCPIFPAVTCTAQATLRTATEPASHNMPANGFYDRALRKTWFWEQSSALVQGPRIWEDFRQHGGRVGMYFFQQSLGESVDEIISPAPIHCHGGGMIMSCYSKPATLADTLGHVKLYQYWGPLASHRSSRAITEMLIKRLARGDAPELMFAYLPCLDYDLQRFGPASPKIQPALQEVQRELSGLFTAARAAGYDVVATGDYAITPAEDYACPNRALHQAGLFATRTIRGMLYPDFHQSAAFAVVDHQVALIYIQDPSQTQAVCDTIRSLPQVDRIEPGTHSEFVATAKPGTWFHWSWWDTPKQAPDYANHVDIHNKPGFDPCELFFKPLFGAEKDPRRIKGTHGRDDTPVAYATTLELTPTTFTELAQAIQTIL